MHIKHCAVSYYLCRTMQKHSFCVGSRVCVLTISVSHRNTSLVRFISFTNFNAQFVYSLTICMLHYNPRHVSSINMTIFRRTNCIITAPGIVTLCKRLYSRPDESRLSLLSSGILYCTESDDSRYCVNTICPPEDGHVDARNMSRIVI